METSDNMTSDAPSEFTQNTVSNEDGPKEDTQDNSTGKTPRRVLHFSDGVMEEYSTDEEDGAENPPTTKAVDTKKLTWPQYALYATMAFGNGTLKVCDYLGEGLASFFGITTPKYQYEINEYERMVKEQEEAKKKEDIEMRGWHDNNTNGDVPVVLASPSPAVTTETETPQRY